MRVGITKQRIITLSVVMGLSLIGSDSAQAIVYGELDGDGHPHVGLMVAQDGKGKVLWRCSGTLLGPRLFLTAGHCTAAPAKHIEIWFDADVESGIPDNGYPFEGDVGGTPFTHPDYEPRAFYLLDLGVVVLSKPMKMERYGELPQLNELTHLAQQRPRRKISFTTVGYGDQRIHPVDPEGDLIRMRATPRLLQIDTAYTGDYSVLLSNNYSTGGSCFGDSGGPNFLEDTDVIAGVTSYGQNGQCAGTGGVYRVDQADALDWLHGELGHLLAKPKK